MWCSCSGLRPSPVLRAAICLIDRMLQRDPKQRASLEEIESHAWLRGVDPSPATKFSTPLVSHKNLSEEEHGSIIQRMVLGDIADREAIVEALETNKYNHITATYYLLAERILREKQEKDVPTRSSSPSNIKAQFRQSWPTRVDMHQDIEDSLAASPISHGGGPQSPARSTENLLNGHRSKGLLELGRREETASDSPGQPAQGACAATSGPAPGSGTSRAPAPSTSAAAKQRACLFRVEEDEEEEEEQEPPPVRTQVVLRRKPPSITNRLTSRKSAPVLKQIFEEGESDDDFGLDEGLPPKLSRLRMNMAGHATNLSAGARASSSPGATQKRYHWRKSQGRGSSCSSSETSDDDSESHRRRLDKDSGFGYSWNRRDSSEGPPSSPGGGNGGNGGGSSSEPSKPPGEGGGTSGPDRGSPPAGGGNGGGGGGGCNKGQDSPSSCCNNSSTPSPSLRAPPHTASRSAALVESLKLMSLCLQHHRSGGGRFIIDPRSLSGGEIQEKLAWGVCISSTERLDTLPIPPPAPARTHSVQHHHRRAGGHGRAGRDPPSNLSALLQLPLCEKTISVNIQRGGGCTSAPPSCCRVI
ncbi:SNF-related serine/threonine-protein kinase-like [Brachionichthys hirsutus]|uniref:SNF-related serine/threonine-protein kinase-like n=1 Tax=Brachionichthys hirsutus TaxID=412623 RepID=UPI003604CB5D